MDKTRSTMWDSTKTAPEHAERCARVTEEIVRILCAQILTEVEPDTDLIESGVLDSVGVVRLLAEIEEHFGVSLAIEDLGIEDIRSIASLAELVGREIAGGLEEEAAPESLPRSACQA